MYINQEDETIIPMHVVCSKCKTHIRPLTSIPTKGYLCLECIAEIEDESLKPAPAVKHTDRERGLFFKYR